MRDALDHLGQVELVSIDFTPKGITRKTMPIAPTLLEDS